MIEKILTMPKVELHLHLDGSLDIDAVAKDKNISKDKLIQLMTVSKDCQNLNEYLEKFDYPISIMQTEKELESSMFNLCEKLKKQNVIYAEIRFAPAFHTKKGLTQEDVIKSVLRGLNKSNTNYNIILCCMRNLDIDTNLETVKLANKYRNNRVVAIDLAGAEALYPTSDFKAIFKMAKEMNVNYTIHAGEADGPTSIKAALSFGTTRLGHGIKCIEDQSLIKYIKDNNITLEICPTSNIQTRAVTSIENHPIYYLYKNGIKTTINTDNMTVSNIDLKTEYKNLIEAFNLNLDDFKAMNINAIEASFLNENEKGALKEIINNYN